MNRRLRIGAAALVCAGAAGVLSGCGGSSDGLSDSARRTLRSDMSALASAASGGNRGKARTELAALQSDLGRLHTDGGVSDDAFSRIQDSANAVALSLGEHPSTSAPASSSSSSTSAPAPSTRSTTRTHHSQAPQPPASTPTTPSATPTMPSSSAQQSTSHASSSTSQQTKSRGSGGGGGNG